EAPGEECSAVEIDGRALRRIGVSVDPYWNIGDGGILDGGDRGALLHGGNVTGLKSAHVRRIWRGGGRWWDLGDDLLDLGVQGHVSVSLKILKWCANGAAALSIRGQRRRRHRRVCRGSDRLVVDLLLLRECGLSCGLSVPGFAGDAL